MSNTSMHAAVVHAFGKPLTLEELPIPEIQKDQVLIKLETSGVCHTDLHAANGDWPFKPTLPFIPGHEGAGFVAAVGSDVRSFKEGDRVGVPWLFDACGECDYCQTGWETLCEKQRNTGYSINGCFADYVAASAGYIAHIPDKMEFMTASPTLCAGVTTYKGLKETQIKAGEWVAIVGVGGLGHMAVEYAKAMGFHVVAIDIAQDKLDLAKKVGADMTVLASKDVDPSDVIQNELKGVHGVLVTAVSPPAFRQAVGMLRRGGTCVLVGLPPGEFPMPIFDVVLKRLTVRGSIVGTRQDLREALQIAQDYNIKPSIEVQPLSAINEIFARLEKGDVTGRVVLDMAATTDSSDKSRSHATGL
ncbi:MAG: alcohol dehydrogenase AdhP [Acidobacteriota bacterium]